jgi:enamine deaminase RidA (YjgF/YER057c/UK114 family)
MVQDKLQKLGISLPVPPKPLAAYIPARKSGNLVYISGQLPLKDGTLMMTGPMTPGRNIEEAKAAMKQCFINGLSAATQVCDLESIKGVVRLGAFVSGTPDFTEQHLVANGASEIIPDIFGDQGYHARAAVGVSSLPLDATVELEILFEISE